MSRPRAALALLALALLAGGCGAPGRSMPRRVVLLVTGFMQGQLHDYERLAPGGRRTRVQAGALRMNTFLKELEARHARRADTLLRLDLGDFMSGSSYSGSPEAMATRGQASAAVMASRHYHGILLGNREFNFGARRLAALIHHPPGGGHLPVVSSNLFVRGQGHQTSGFPPDYVHAEIHHDVGPMARGVRLLGITPLDLALRAEPAAIAGLGVEQDVRWLLHRRAPRKRAGEDGELTIVLSQLDVVGQREMLEEAVEGTGVDLVLGHAYGRGADAHRSGATWFAGLRNDRPGSAVLVLDLLVDPATGRIAGLEEQWYVLAGGDLDADERERIRREADEAGWSAGGLYPDLPRGKDPALMRTLATLGSEMAALDATIGSSRTALLGDYERESTLGNLVADALRARAKADIGLVSASVVDGVAVSEGTLLERDLYRIYRYPNEVLSVAVPGSRLREALARKVADGIHHQVSGVSLAWRPAAPGADQGELVALEVNGQPIDPAREYTVAMDSFAFRRNPVFEGLTPVEHGLCRDAVRAFLADSSPVAPRLERRIRLLHRTR